MQRYFIQQTQISEEIMLPADIYKHAVVVLRMKVGAKFELVSQDQTIHLMEITRIENKSAYAKLCERYVKEVELPVKVSIVCGVSKGDKAEWIVQKGTELGANQFIFYNADYSVAKWDAKKAPKKCKRLSKIAQAAAEQSHRTIIPTVKFVQDFNEILQMESTQKIVAYEEAAKEGEKSQLLLSLRQLKKEKTPHLLALFGPEGGISTKEITRLKQADFALVGMGPRIMRAETAPLYLLSALSFMFELE
ncbi:16S rRNA (uracil(1498)-N(3))-methyltransferase [Ligilactobacillus sp. Marseille-Q7487]|uniref:16S rRNA (uracil(1498)-N(3))-methyltransferase n=1 Tax=Ligilactobacillus sp. Marseille-Q7487 TaxID=3022128 RepID=UPI0024A932E8|nr:16S rRNA (uracil(1498)-N(3))-methyltransferase [Ligilactobacillus sp. Marseille-Q7487]